MTSCADKDMRIHVADVDELPVLRSDDRRDAVGVIIVDDMDKYWPLAGAERDLPDGGFSSVDESESGRE